MSSIEQSILDSIEILLNKRVSQLDFDKTVRATVTAIVDQSIGKYKVQYQNSKFDAYSADSDASYDVDDQVYVEIPSSDYNKTKLIVGSVKQLGTKYIDAVTSQGKMTIVGTNILSSSKTVELCSYNGTQQFSVFDLIDVDTLALETYKNQKKYLLLGMNVKTSLPSEQQVSGGNYGIILQAKYYNSAYKNQQVQSENDLITRTYVLDVNNMQGQPYKYTLKNRQYAIFSIDGDNLKEITDIQAFCTGFPVTKTDQPSDIFLSDFELEFMEPLTSTELNGSSLKILTPKGAYLTSANDDTKYLQAELKIKGKKVNYQAQTVKFYWFIKDTTVKASSSTKYSSYAGQGWRCLNQYQTYNGVTQFIAQGYTKSLMPSMVPAKINTFKCVAVYDDTTLSAIIDIENKVSTTSISISSSAGTQFYFDTGKTTLKCNVVTTLPNLTYQWAYRTGGAAALTYVNQNPVVSNSIDITIAQATETITYECTVLTNTSYLGVATITLTNGVPQNEYTLVINNGTQVFKYDEYGVSPASNSAEKPITIPTLTFDIYNDQGQLVTPSSAEEIVKSCDIKWIWPDEDFTMLQHGTFDLTEDLIVNPTTNGNLLRYVLTNSSSLAFEVANRYDIDATDNNIRLEVNFQGHALVASTNFTFTKDGELGTNGTEYISRLVPFRDIYDQVYLENGHIQTWYDTISKSYDAETGKYTNVDTYVFTQASINRPLRAQMWNGNASALYDSQTNTSSIDADLSWQMVDVGKNTTHNAEVSAQGVITHTGYNNVSTVVKSIISTSELSQLAKKYYATYPLTVVKTPNNTLHAIVAGGYTQCMYNSDGTRGNFNTKPFTLRIFTGAAQKVLDISKISWYTSWYTDKKNTALAGQNGVQIEPPAVYDSQTTNNYIVVTYSDDDGDYKVIISVHLYLNRYGLSAMNDWDGTSVKINSEGDQYILAPQIGAGEKGDDNSFTGITMGKSFGVDGNSSDPQIGLMGFKDGVRSIFLDAQTGRAMFGAANSSQIVVSPEKYGVAPSGSIYSWNYYNCDRTGKPTSKRNAGMLIDLDQPSITFGSGNFTVNSSGHLTAKGGGSIAGWQISDTVLRSSDGGTALYSSGDKRLSVRDKFIVYSDGRFSASNNKFSVDAEGNITATGGTIGGWNIGSSTLQGGGTTLNSNGTITCVNLQASTSGKIGGWTINSSNLQGGNISLNANGSIVGPSWNITTGGVATFTDVRISSGNTTSTLDWGSNFKVDGAGNMTALSGNIGGWTLSSSGFSSGNFTVTPAGGITTPGCTISPSGDIKTSGNIDVGGNGNLCGCTVSNGNVSVDRAHISSANMENLYLNGRRVSWTSLTYVTDITSLRPIRHKFPYIRSLSVTKGHTAAGDSVVTNVEFNSDSTNPMFGATIYYSTITTTVLGGGSSGSSQRSTHD